MDGISQTIWALMLVGKKGTWKPPGEGVEEGSHVQSVALSRNKCNHDGLQGRTGAFTLFPTASIG